MSLGRLQPIAAQQFIWLLSGLIADVLHGSSARAEHHECCAQITPAKLPKENCGAIKETAN